MAFTKFLLPALTLATAALADSCGSSDPVTVTAAQAVSSIAACSTYSGDVVLQTGAASGGKVDLGNLEKIDGKFEYGGDDSLQTLAAGSLESVGDFNLTNLVHLSALNMGKLSEAGNMTLIGLGSLNSFDFGTPGIRKAGRITIVNTQIAMLNGINQATELDGLIVSDNKFLAEIGLNLSKVGSIDIGPNNVVQGQKANFPKLQSATFLNFRNCSSVSVPSLANVSTILGLYGNTFQSFSAPNLTWAGGLVVDDNPSLTNLSFPQLKTLNSSNATLQVANNSHLTKVDGFSQLTEVKGNVDFSGAMDEIDLVSNIKSVAGAFVVDTSSNKLDCGPVNNLGNQQVVRGSVNCKTQDSNPTTSNGGSGTGSGSSSSSNAAVPMELPTFVTGSGILASLLSLLL